TNLSVGWNPTVAGPNGPVVQGIINQSGFSEVSMARPFAMAMRPDGQRALVAMHETGNFGVLDLDAQLNFKTVPNPNPALANLNDEFFKAYVAATPAIRLGPDHVALNGAIASDKFVPSLDERLLFPWQVEYAQNGKFAVATHQGRTSPGFIDAKIPDFHHNLDNQERLFDSRVAFP